MRPNPISFGLTGVPEQLDLRINSTITRRNFDDFFVYPNRIPLSGKSSLRDREHIMQESFVMIENRQRSRIWSILKTLVKCGDFWDLSQHVRV